MLISGGAYIFQVPMEAGRGCPGSPRAEMTGSCELPGMGAGDLTGVLRKCNACS